MIRMNKIQKQPPNITFEQRARRHTPHPVNPVILSNRTESSKRPGILDRMIRMNKIQKQPPNTFEQRARRDHWSRQRLPILSIP